ncbi:hypothetical protein [Veillonella criceti]|uniref:DUF5082 domain-containing protein n=1 Tax=Veillonella criceti TaxID=103891 RepID=A0A380Q0Z2_9FIRM|nr:hypothetical protein [Veillonella criceti]SUP79486.1 Uncharacterised protein [Veillonella criceti]
MNNLQKQVNKLNADLENLNAKKKNLSEKEARINKAFKLASKKEQRKEREHKLFQFAAEIDKNFGNVITNASSIDEVKYIANECSNYIDLGIQINKIFNREFEKITSSQELTIFIDKILDQLKKK